uniref:HTH cro/C1-type domain-containing protein n=1 Tax=viral metagenome TaxID=1070528 RepID=A0A6M3JFJ3_9ZZZZ
MNSILNGLDTAGKIKALIASRNKSQPDLATILGVSLGTIQNRLEKNDWRMDELKVISNEFQVDLTDLL